MPNVRLIRITPEAEKLMAFCARVSSPENQHTKTPDGLLRYCMANGHWSVFELAHAVLEIETSRAISAQILRHKTFSFQEFSQRYADVSKLSDENGMFEPISLRRQDTKNRQNSTDDLDPKLVERLEQEIMIRLEDLEHFYGKMLELGVAKECARMILPMTTRTKLYMAGNIRSWIHYIQVRTDPSTQFNHREVALMARDVLAGELPIIAQAAGWTTVEGNAG